MRFSVRMEKMMVKPYPHYYFVKVDTGLPRHDERTGKMFYQNYDEHVYDAMNKYCGYKFGRMCRTRYNEFYFRTKEELLTFKKEWEHREID